MYTIAFTKEEDDAHRTRMHELAKAFPLKDEPDTVVETLGEHVGNGHATIYKMLHAADLVLADRRGRMMLIQRNFPPLGLAPAGGMMDELPDGRIETTKETALREAKEEINIDVPEGALFIQVRPRTIAEAAIRRVAPIPDFMDKYDVREGDYCSVTTIINCLLVDDIDAFDCHARSDARSLQMVQFNPATEHLHLDDTDGKMVTAEDFAISDLYDGVMLAREKLAAFMPAFASGLRPQPAASTSSGCRPQ